MNPSKVRTLAIFCAFFAIAAVGTGIQIALWAFAPERAFPLFPLIMAWVAAAAYAMVAVPNLCTGYEMELEDDELYLILERREREG